MVETRHQSASNDENQRSSELLEEEEVSPTPPIQQNDGPIAEVLKQLDSSALTLGFTADDILAFLLYRSADQQRPSESKPSTPYHPAALDPSLSKTTENSTYDLRSLAKDKFTSFAKKNKQRFDRLDRILDNNGLYTMARRTRLCPIYSEANPTGQKKEVVTFNGDLVTIIKADNFTLWAHDIRRLNHILDQAFDIDLRHHTNGFNTKNGIQVYTDLREYYFGQNNNGARETRTAFDAFRIKSTSHSIRQDIVKFEELRSQWEYAVDLKFNGKMNDGYLDEKFDADPGPGVVASLSASSLSRLTYQQRLDALHNLHNCDTFFSK